MNKPQLTFQYVHSNRIGYGVHGIETHKALTSIGIDVYDGLPGSGDEAIADKRAKVCKDVLHLAITNHIRGWWEGQRSHLFTMWETTELPDAISNTVHAYDTILVPSESCRETYSRYNDNVHVVPLGVDARRWGFRERQDSAFFNFLIAGTGPRKGNDLVHRAFLELFADKDVAHGKRIPRLLMKNLKREQYRGRNVTVLGGYMPPEDEVALYASAHCYVQPSRGEGWGMQPLQAMAQGCPTILTDAHGHSAFAEYGVPISASLTPATYMTMFGAAGDWWEPDYEQLKEAMWNAYNDYDSHLTQAVSASAKIREQFTWERSAEAIVEAIGGREKLSERFRPAEIPAHWHEPDPKLFRVVALRNWTADIAGVTHILKAGKEYWKSADVKRILFEGDVLDPECLSDGDGLTVTQLERLGAYIDDHSSCPTCLRPYDKSQEVG